MNKEIEKLNFPAGFLWGSATSAYQVEGGIKNCDWSEVYPAGRACDQYNLYEKDFDLIKKLNQNTYRFSIEWSRIEPEEGKWNGNEIEHYRKMILALRERKIESFVALHHFTSPLWFIQKGGFEKKKNVFYFVRFANKVFNEYHDLVKFWITINEPEQYVMHGYIGLWASLWPPFKKNIFLFLKVLRNFIIAHHQIFNSFHKKDKAVKVSVVISSSYYEPLHRYSPLDQLAVFIINFLRNHFFISRVKKHIDFIAINNYHHDRIAFPFQLRNENKVVSDLGWEIYPEAIYRVLLEYKKYKKPIYVTENGVADAKDILRKDFIKEHLFWVHKAIEEGVDVRGYLHWSLMDNFEWDKGFWPRFGLIEIDYKTMERKLRPSAFYYAEICKNNALNLEK